MTTKKKVARYTLDSYIGYGLSQTFCWSNRRFESCSTIVSDIWWEISDIISGEIVVAKDPVEVDRNCLNQLFTDLTFGSGK